MFKMYTRRNFESFFFATYSVLTYFVPNEMTWFLSVKCRTQLQKWVQSHTHAEAMLYHRYVRSTILNSVCCSNSRLIFQCCNSVDFNYDASVISGIQFQQKFECVINFLLLFSFLNRINQTYSMDTFLASLCSQNI